MPLASPDINITTLRNDAPKLGSLGRYRKGEKRGKYTSLFVLLGLNILVNLLYIFFFILYNMKRSCCGTPQFPINSILLNKT